MEGVRKLARSQSIKLCEKLKIPVRETESTLSVSLFLAFSLVERERASLSVREIER